MDLLDLVPESEILLRLTRPHPQTGKPQAVLMQGNWKGTAVLETSGEEGSEPRVTLTLERDPAALYPDEQGKVYLSAELGVDACPLENRPGPGEYAPRRDPDDDAARLPYSKPPDSSED